MGRRVAILLGTITIACSGLVSPAASGDAARDGVPIALLCEPAPELCNAFDDDCDGFTDEDFPLGQLCLSGVGACARFGTYACSPDGQSAVCDASPGPPSTEVCDEIDNDCDGAVDEDCGCTPPAGTPSLAVSASAPGSASATLSWGAIPSAAGYDAVRGDLGLLLGSGGNFSSAAQECLANDQPGTTLVHAPAPAPGAGTWYLVRATG